MYCTDLPAQEVRKHLAELGTQRTPEQQAEQQAEFAANQAASKKQFLAQGVKLRETTYVG